MDELKRFYDEIEKFYNLDRFTEENILKISVSDLQRKIALQFQLDYGLKVYPEIYEVKQTGENTALATLDLEGNKAKVNFVFNKDGLVVDYSIVGFDDLKKKLGIKTYAVKVPQVGIYQVEASNEKFAVRKVLSSLFEEIDKIEFYNRRFTRNNIEEFADLIIQASYVKEWEDFIKAGETEEKRIEDLVPQSVVEVERRLPDLSSAFIEKEHELEKLFTEKEKEVYGILKSEYEKKKVIESVIEDYLKDMGIDAVVSVASYDEQRNILKGSFYIQSSYVNGEFPFVAELEDGGIKSVLIRDAEIKKVAGLKVYSLTLPQHGELTFFATDVPVVVNAVSNIIGRNITFDELIDKYNLKVLGEVEMVYNDALKQNPWTKIKIAEDEFLIRLK